MDIKKCTRISIIGCCGSGKSVLAQKLGRLLDIPVYHMDSYYWGPKWAKENQKELENQIEKITHTDAWILDGNYPVTLPNRFMRSDLIIFLNLPLEFCIQSVKERHAKNEYIGMPECTANEENLEEIIALIKGFPEKMKEINPLLESHKHKVIELHTRKEVDELMV